MGRLFYITVFCWINIFSQSHEADLVLSPREGILLQPLSTVSIRWQTSYQGSVKILFSTDDGKSWKEISSETDPSAGEFIWNIPDVISDRCRIRIVSVQSAGPDFQSSTFIIGDINKYFGAKWNGQIPQFQPYNTTDYYGSGDADLNGIVDQADVSYSDKIISGSKQANIRADVNGDQMITSEDRVMIQAAVNGDTLPAWWNIIVNKSEKLEWLKKMLRIDLTDEHEYIPGKFECAAFAAQLSRKFAGMNEFSSTHFGSQTIFNLPVYYVLINPPSGTPHNLNTVFTGDDPRDFSSWTFIEPQNDDITGLSNYPSGTELFIMPLSLPYLIKFERTSDTWILKYLSSSLVLKKPVILPDIDSKPACWNPILLPDAAILFERAADDMNREYKIHISAPDSMLTEQARPLLPSAGRSHIVFSRASGAVTHLIWEEPSEAGAVYFYGYIEPGGREVRNIQKLTFLIPGRLTKLNMFISGDKGYLFWLSNTTEDVGKVFYSAFNNGSWSTPEFINIGKENAAIIDYEAGDDREGNFHLFVTVKTTYWNKLLILSSDKGWTNTYNGDYVAGSEIIFSDHCFFVAQRRGYPWDSVTDVGMYTRLDGKWNIIYSTFYGILLQVVSTGNQEIPFYLTGAGKNGNEYLLERASVINSYITDHYTFENAALSISADMSCAYLNNTLYIAWRDNSSTQIKIKSYNTAVSSVEEQSGTLTFQLLQNYPNPFNNKTSIKYRISEEGRAVIKLFDLTGREVKSIIDKNHTAGEHTAYFNASELVSGIYLYQLISGKKIITKKMILLK